MIIASENGQLRIVTGFVEQPQRVRASVQKERET